MKYLLHVMWLSFETLFPLQIKVIRPLTDQPGNLTHLYGHLVNIAKCLLPIGDRIDGVSLY